MLAAGAAFLRRRVRRLALRFAPFRFAAFRFGERRLAAFLADLRLAPFLAAFLRDFFLAAIPFTPITWTGFDTPKPR